MLHLWDAPWVCVSSSETKQQQIDSAGDRNRDSVCSVSLTHKHASECARWHTLEEHLWSCVWRKRIVCVRRFWCQQLRGKQLTLTHTLSRAWGHVWTRSCDLWTDRRRWRRAGDEERRARSRTDRWGRSRLTPDLGEWTSQTHTNTHKHTHTGQEQVNPEAALPVERVGWKHWGYATSAGGFSLLECVAFILDAEETFKVCLDKVPTLIQAVWCCSVLYYGFICFETKLKSLRVCLSISVSILEIRTKANETEGCRPAHISWPDCIDSKLIFTLTHVHWCQQIGFLSFMQRTDYKKR